MQTDTHAQELVVATFTPGSALQLIMPNVVFSEFQLELVVDDRALFGNLEYLHAAEKGWWSFEVETLVIAIDRRTSNQDDVLHLVVSPRSFVTPASLGTDDTQRSTTLAEHVFILPSAWVVSLDPTQWSRVELSGLPIPMREFLEIYATQRRLAAKARRSSTGRGRQRSGPRLIIIVNSLTLTSGDSELLDRVGALTMLADELPEFIVEFRRVLAAIPPLADPPPLERIINSPLLSKDHLPNAELETDMLASLLTFDEADLEEA